jgi:phosphatidylserine/phosphatidylglycerophosphate/cardiolipin synthase-like enzyme
VEILVANGVLFGSPDKWERNISACTPSLAAALQGAAVGQRAIYEKESPIVAATMPLGFGALGAILPGLGLRHAFVETTDNVFTEIARSAENDFTIFAPFLNKEGALWIRDLLITSPAADRFLILRDWSRARPILSPIMTELSAHKVKIFDYFIPYEDRYETFHAKLLLADDTRAYVGSANFLRYRKNSLELGVMVKGHAARTIRFISEAMKRVSLPVHYPTCHSRQN